MRKEVKFQAIMDTESFDRSIAEMQRKFETLRTHQATTQRVQQAGIPGASGAGQDAFQKAYLGSIRDMEKSVKEQVANQEKLAKIMIQKAIF